MRKVAMAYQSRTMYLTFENRMRNLMKIVHRNEKRGVFSAFQRIKNTGVKERIRRQIQKRNAEKI